METDIRFSSSTKNPHMSHSILCDNSALSNLHVFNNENGNNNCEEWLEPRIFDRAELSHNKLCDICGFLVEVEKRVSPEIKQKTLTIRESFKLKLEKKVQRLNVENNSASQVDQSHIKVDSANSTEVGYCMYCNVVVHVSCMCMEFEKTLQSTVKSTHLPSITQKQNVNCKRSLENNEVVKHRTMNMQLIRQNKWTCKLFS